MSPRTPRRAPLGFTLVELLVALGVSALTVAAAMTLLIQQQRSYASTSGDRAQQEAGRLALQDLVAKLKHAGFGVDPNLALDFGENTGAQDGTPRTNLNGAATLVKASSFKCATPVTCRDRTDGSDEIVFYSRDPWFQRIATGVASDLLKLRGDLKRPIYQGQILQVACLGGARIRAYVTVKKTVDPVVPPDENAEVSVELEPGQKDDGREVFPYENAQLSAACFGDKTVGSEPVVTAVDRYRYYVGWYSLAGAPGAPPHSVGARPYLMLDQGLSDDDGEILVPIAPDVEDVQFAYYYPPGTAGGPPRLLGATAGVGVGEGAFKLQTDVVPPGMDDMLDSPPRLTGHPANVEAVRVSVVVRAPEADVGLTPLEGATVPPVANRTMLDGQPYHRRSVFETTVLLRNLESTYFLYPVVD